MTHGERMGPGGSHGLQNRSRPDSVGLGGFDSHALPPSPGRSPECSGSHRREAMSVFALRRSAVAVMTWCVLATPLGAQQRDSLRLNPVVLTTAPDSLAPPLTPRRAFLYSFLAPGYA